MQKKRFNTSFDSILLEESQKKDQDIHTHKNVRTTVIARADYIDKVKAIAYWERKKIKDILNESLKDYILKYEKEKGSIKVPH